MQIILVSLGALVLGAMVLSWIVGVVLGESGEDAIGCGCFALGVVAVILVALGLAIRAVLWIAGA